MARNDFTGEGPNAEYDPDYQWLPASDRQGHSADVRYKVPKNWVGRIQSFVHSGRFKYRSQSDFLRDAIYHRMYWAENYMDSESGKRSLAMEKMMAEVSEYANRHEEYERFKTELESAYRSSRLGGDFDGLAKVLDSVEDTARLELDGAELNNMLDLITQYRKLVR